MTIDIPTRVHLNNFNNLSRVVEGQARRNHGNQPPGGMVLIPAEEFLEDELVMEQFAPALSSQERVFFCRKAGV
jgi:hypothetical protein